MELEMKQKIELGLTAEEVKKRQEKDLVNYDTSCLLYTSPSPRDCS